MKKSLIIKWTDALRSGKYKQAREELRSPDGRFCCLGVLCDIVKPDGWHGDRGRFHDLGSCNQLSPKACADLGLPTDIMRGLYHANDGESVDADRSPTRDFVKRDMEMGDPVPMTFEEIADVIDREVPVEED